MRNLVNDWKKSAGASRTSGIQAHFGRGERTRRFPVGASVLVLVALLTAGCGDGVEIPAQLRTPTVAGVVQGKTQFVDRHWRYELANGQTIDIDYDETTSLLGGPDVGRLLLEGTDPDGRRWVAGIVPAGDIDRRPGCYELVTQGRAVDGWIETESGFRLHKSSGFQDFRATHSDLFAASQGRFCLDQKGEVTSYDI